MAENETAPCAPVIKAMIPLLDDYPVFKRRLEKLLDETFLEIPETRYIYWSKLHEIMRDRIQTHCGEADRQRLLPVMRAYHSSGDWAWGQ